MTTNPNTTTEGGASFNCGHERSGRNVLWFGNGARRSSRCRKCHNAFQTARQAASRRALRYVIAMHRAGDLSEGQVAKATGLHRIEIRKLADEA